MARLCGSERRRLVNRDDDDERPISLSVWTGWGMGQALSSSSTLGLYDSNMDKEATREINERRARSITAKIGVIAAYFHRARQGKSLPPVRSRT